MSQQEPQETQTPQTFELPIWLVVLVLAVCLVGGGLYIWRATGSQPRRTLSEDIRPEQGPAIPASPVRPNVPNVPNAPPGPSIGTANITEAAFDASPTPITLRLKDVTAQAAFEALAKASGARFRPNQPDLWMRQVLPATVYDIDLDRQSFWAALQQICARTGIQPYSDGSASGEISLQRAYGGDLWADRPSVSQGPIRLVLQNLSRTDQVELAPSQAPSHTCVAHFQVYADPKLRVQQVVQPVLLEEAVDEKGNSLIPYQDNGGSTFFWGSSGGWSYSASAPMNRPPSAGTRLARLKGKLAVQVMSKAQILEIPDVLAARNLEEDLGPCRVRFNQLSGSGNSYRLSITLLRNQMDPQEWQQFTRMAFQTIPRQIRLLDANGRAYSSSGAGGGSSNDYVNLDAIFYNRGGNGPDAPGAPVKLLWEFPTETQDIVVPFEFTNLPLP